MLGGGLTTFILLGNGLSASPPDIKTGDFHVVDLVEQPAQEMRKPLSVKLIFKKVKSDGALQYNLKLKNRLEEEIVARHSIEILDDRGKSMTDVLISDQAYFKSNSQNHASVELNQPLPDGYYIVRAKVVSLSKNGDESNAFDEAFLEVIDGTRSVINEEEFNNLSLINIGTKVPMEVEGNHE